MCVWGDVWIAISVTKDSSIYAIDSMKTYTFQISLSLCLVSISIAASLNIYISRKLFKLGEPDMQDIAGEAEMNS